MEPEETPVIVKDSAAPAQLMTALRSLLLAAGAYAVGRGWVDDGLVQAAVPVLLIVGPLIWSQFSTRKKQAQLVTLANRVPDSVAKVV